MSGVGVCGRSHSNAPEAAARDDRGWGQEEERRKRGRSLGRHECLYRESGPEEGLWCIFARGQSDRKVRVGTEFRYAYAMGRNGFHFSISIKNINRAPFGWHTRSTTGHDLAWRGRF